MLGSAIAFTKPVWFTAAYMVIWNAAIAFVKVTYSEIEYITIYIYIYERIAYEISCPSTATAHIINFIT